MQTNGQAVSSSTRLHESCQNIISVFSPFISDIPLYHRVFEFDTIEVSVEGEGIGEKGQRDLNDLKVEFSGIEMLIYPFRPPSLLGSSSCEGWQPWTQSLHLYRTCKNFAKHNLTSFLFRQRDFDHKSADVRSSNSTI